MTSGGAKKRIITTRGASRELSAVLTGASASQGGLITMTPQTEGHAGAKWARLAAFSWTRQVIQRLRPDPAVACIVSFTAGSVAAAGKRATIHARCFVAQA